MKDGELLRTTLPLSDKVVLAALYSILMTELVDKVPSEHLFAKQDYYRRLLGRGGISSDSFSVYLSRLSSAGVISIRKVGRGKGMGTESYVQLRYPTTSLRYMIEKDGELSKLLPVIEAEIKEARGRGSY
jgi:Cdc6-like AAA superfamily ATPase